jgi:hypothetical protein
MALRELIEDEKGALSTARCGLWVTVVVALLTVWTDIYLTVWTTIVARVPNPAYALEATMFTVFAAWAAGPRIAQYIGPQIGAASAAVASATRDTIAKRRAAGKEFDAEPA